MIIRNKYLGIDVGSVAISVVLVDANKKIIQTSYEFHEGRISTKLTEILAGFPMPEICGIATTSSTPSFIRKVQSYDNRVSFISAVKELHKNAGSILIVGGEKFGLVLFDENLQYRKFRSNSSCAAGTGSFLDQQARRLNLNSISEFSELACTNTGEFPKIASRCSVFAKTDLIHAQQEGYTLSEICDGLCFGLAKNITDRLFNDSNITLPLVFVGGVSRNKAVAKHIEQLTGIKLETGNNSHLYGAIGAAFNLLYEKEKCVGFELIDVNDIILPGTRSNKFFYEPLQLEMSEYPDFSSLEKYNFNSKIIKNSPHVEVDIYKQLEKKRYSVYLGIDVGSTSTKALLLEKNKMVLAGFYTRTSGQPVTAVRVIFEAVQNIVHSKNIEINFLGAGTTGSGRKFIGRIIGADIIPDEISAHARAALELDKDVDTIIEIGGQDAKFTTLSNGSVTFSVMNNVCAAGTGSFIEEQAKKLGVPLSEFSERAEHSKAPMASDRCTVFMERDLNQYINEDYKTNEILASVLHSVRENYLSKVAVEKNIGNKIFFQGATAKNRALIAAFEQKLKKPIMVSEYCHLTGAYGVALELADKNHKKSNFRGIKLYKHEIQVRSEVCNLCTNHCKYKIAEVEGETVVYGFLCGRDYNSDKFVDNNTSGFNLVQAYSNHFKYKPVNSEKSKVTVGIPAGLYLFEDLFFWQHFFDLLNIKTLTSLNFRDAVKTGKRISGAEFCAPMNAIQGHVLHLSDKTDFIFLPTYLEKNSTKNKRRQYCYYSQFAPPIVLAIDGIGEKCKIINPVLFSLQSELSLKNELYKALKSVGLNGFDRIALSNAYNKANKENQKRKESWSAKFTELSAQDKNLKVVLLGRPYTILSQTMNNNIPDIFAQKGVKTFFQDMLNIQEKDVEGLREIFDATKWKYAATILATADKIGRTADLYPVFITSFKCSPDSFILEYFRQIMDKYKKPYLILQLDEYDSNVGYETRIEAALRSFQNHYRKKEIVGFTKINHSANNLISDVNKLKGKNLLMPSLGDYPSKLLEANLRRNGINAHTLFDSEESIKKSLISNNGQCLPLNIILQNAFDYVDKHKLDPQNTVIWMMESPISCNLGMFINYMSKLLKTDENGYNKIKIYPGLISFADFSLNVSINTYLAFLFGGYIRKLECKLRPYEIQKGQTDEVVKKSMELLYDTFFEGTSKEKALKQVIEWFKGIEVQKEIRPKVAVFGDLYARDNDVFNQNLIRFIEVNGGEVITTPYSEYVKIIVEPYNKRLINEGFYSKAAVRKLLITIALQVEGKYLKYFNEILNEPVSKTLKDFSRKLEKLNLRTSYNGESIDNVLKIFHLSEQHPEIALFVQTNPSFCCPSLVTEAMTNKMEKISGIPIVTIEYDGTSSNKNEAIIPFLKYAKV